MKDTQGNIITEEEFTKDIGHRAESNHYCCATQENEGECNCEESIRETIKNGAEEMSDEYIMKLSDMTPEEAYKLGKCVGVQKEQERWSKEMVPIIKQNSFEKGQEEYKKFILNVLDGVDMADQAINNIGGGTKAIRLAILSKLI